MSPVLDCRGLAAGYAGRAVVSDFDLTLGEGEIVALLGGNGAGKTTTLLTLAGLVPSLAGTLRLGDRSTSRTSAPFARSGHLVLVPDDRSLFTTLTVRENLVLARGATDVSVAEVLGYLPALTRRLQVKAGMLSGGEQQMLALGRAFLQRPRVLLIDELSMGLAPVVVETLLSFVARIVAERGTALVLVEQHVQLALAVAGRAVVLAGGRTVETDSAQALLRDPSRLQRAYLGG
jgi:branched-chain amino acid transport system ATP-binding protein